ncbi:MAG: phosphoribosylformylglycinamidine synthase [Velocimicrobium sp.]
MSNVRRIYVEKKFPYAVRAKELKNEIQTYLGIETLEQVRILVRYDIENVSEETFERAKRTVFSEPTVDYLFDETFERNETEVIFTVSYLPGQFDQRADSANQCIKLLNEEEVATVQSATTYVLKGELSEREIKKIKEYCVNPVDSKITKEQKAETLLENYEEPADVLILEGFITMERDACFVLYKSLNLAMTFDDFCYIQTYFMEEENRDPSMTEIRMLDTYWSDHCRHTTFLTEIKNVSVEEGAYKIPIAASYQSYQETRMELLQNEKGNYPSLMNLALIAMKKLKADGTLSDMEESDEINACSIIVPTIIDGVEEEWLVFFKNETHNHPTEIEPFGGAATCLGGAIRDPLSGRGYVYQAMRVTGAADPTRPLEETLEGKLPQKKIVKGAASGYSSYGNQIGLATGLVNEIYHPNYVAKRMEIGAVLGAAPRKNVIREDSLPGDQIILIGGRTGRDGCGGATGSSKAHTSESIHVCGAEVQKGNPPTERKIQRLFRRSEVSSLIKKCNDFGAGGVSVAIGELADGLIINLDLVPKKYAGLDGTELAISESQERMAVVVDAKDVDAMLNFAAQENLEAVVVAEVTKEKRLVMNWRGKNIVSIKRSFLNTNGAHQENDVYIASPKKKASEHNEITGTLKKNWLETLKDLNVCSQKGLVEMFDSSIGAGTVIMPYGGTYQLTPTQTMVAKLPLLKGDCETVTMMSYGLDPYLSSWSPYHGAVYAIISSVAKIVASGGDYRKIHFTFQEYFKRLGKDKERFGEPMAALLGAYEAQMQLGLASIGGKDSMSGTFQDIDVPPTLCSFAVDTGTMNEIVTPELKKAGNILLSLPIKIDAYDLPEYAQVLELYQKIYQLNKEKIICSAYAIGFGGIAEAVSKMAFGNKLGIKLSTDISIKDYFKADYGTILVEVKEEDVKKVASTIKGCIKIGAITDSDKFEYGNETIFIEEAIEAYTQTLEGVFPSKASEDNTTIETKLYDAKEIYVCKQKKAMPKVFIPVFPGTNCEYDSIRAFECAGGDVTSLVFKNQSASDIKESVAHYTKQIRESNIIMLPGGFSAGDEPDGSAKFIASVFRNPYLVEAVNDLLKNRDGLMLGICNGFQALIKLGLVPFGEICECKEDFPTLTTNVIGRHVSKMVQTKVVSNQSPWLRKTKIGEIHAIPVSHGEGRFVANDETLNRLFYNGQVATQYVDLCGNPTMDETYNPNGSFFSIEGITSPDGRVYGKMAHSERKGTGVAINIQGNQNQYLFESGISYFK